MTSYSANLGLAEPTPFDPAVKNSWGTINNLNFTLIDSAVAGILSLDVSLGGSITLTTNQGASDQARNVQFEFTGSLPGVTTVLFPQSKNLFFSVTNSTDGAFALVMGVAGGGGGTTVTVPLDATVLLASDGTNITVRFDTVVGTLTADAFVGDGAGLTGITAAPSGSAGGDLGGTYPHPTVTATHLSAALPVAQGGTGLTAAGTSGNVLTSNGAVWLSSTPSTGVTSIADATNGGLQFSAATGAVTANLRPSDLSTKASPTTADSVVLMDAAASNVAKTATVASIVALASGGITTGTTCTMNPFALNSTQTQAHGLGTTPTMVVAFLECTSTNLNYAVGDRVVWPYSADGNSGAQGGFVVEYDATNVKIIVGASGQVPIIPDKSTRAYTSITAADWKAVAVPYTFS